jgi:hypothetical protein
MKPFAIAAGCLLGSGMIAGPSLAAYMPQDTAVAAQKVTAVCTGVGSSRDDPRWLSYPVRLVFANRSGQFAAGEHLALDHDGRQMAALDCDAPWLLLKLPAGRYSVTATLPREPATRQQTVAFTTGGAGSQREVGVVFPGLAANQ